MLQHRPCKAAFALMLLLADMPHFQTRTLQPLLFWYIVSSPRQAGSGDVVVKSVNPERREMPLTLHRSASAICRFDAPNTMFFTVHALQHDAFYDAARGDSGIGSALRGSCWERSVHRTHPAPFTRQPVSLLRRLF
ncbi:hypothetical protein OH77DRAFT_729236 [Trametes cingulata]|nr:hypothetical protein OH77DRAFT_729236 [Trametes cingulata]